MESTNVNTPVASPLTEQAIVSKPIDNTQYLCKIECAIRRKPNTVGLPGQDPAERIYKIGASLDSNTKGALKGVSGDLEAKFMPEIIGLSTNDPMFRKNIEDYWSTISRLVPHDETYQKEHEKGLIIKIQFHIIGKARQERFNALLSVEDKMKFLNQVLLMPIKDSITGQASTTMQASLDYDHVANFLLLNYCLKYSKVANNIADIDKSPKIDFYIFEKAVAVKNQLNAIELRQKAMSLYQDIEANPRKIDAILLEFGKSPKDFETDTDKLLKIDEEYNTLPIENMKKFVQYASDERWETKYLINLSVANGNVRKPANSSAYYYSDTLLGMTIEDAVDFLNSEEKGKIIKESLSREIKDK